MLLAARQLLALGSTKSQSLMYRCNAMPIKLLLPALRGSPHMIESECSWGLIDPFRSAATTQLRERAQTPVQAPQTWGPVATALYSALVAAHPVLSGVAAQSCRAFKQQQRQLPFQQQNGAGQLMPPNAQTAHRGTTEGCLSYVSDLVDARDLQEGDIL